jgi:hypothetical protein
VRASAFLPIAPPELSAEPLYRGPTLHGSHAIDQCSHWSKPATVGPVPPPSQRAAADRARRLEYAAVRPLPR